MERHLSTEGIGRYYEGFSNSVLWPLLHYLLDRAPVEPSAWEAYWQMIQEFAHAAAQVLPVGGDLIWVHGYQLMLVFASCYAGRAGIQSYGSRWSPAPSIRNIG